MPHAAERAQPAIDHLATAAAAFAAALEVVLATQREALVFEPVIDDRLAARRRLALEALLVPECARCNVAVAVARDGSAAPLAWWPQDECSAVAAIVLWLVISGGVAAWHTRQDWLESERRLECTAATRAAHRWDCWTAVNAYHTLALKRCIMEGLS